MERLPSSDVRWALSTILPCPTRSLRVQEALTHHRPGYSHLSAFSYLRIFSLHTFFLNCLYIASSASLTVTPFRFRAVTSRPSGKWRSIFFTGGLVRNFFSASLSSSVAGDVFSFLWFNESLSRELHFISTATITTTNEPKRIWHDIMMNIWCWWERSYIPVQLLCFLRYHDFFAFLFWKAISLLTLIGASSLRRLRTELLTQIIDVVHSSCARTCPPVTFDSLLGWRWR